MDERQPLIWCLLGHKAGDNTQVLALADELGWPCEHKHIHARSWELLVHLRRSGTLAGIDSSRSSELVAPWPDLVISAGRRNEPVARWIRSRAASRCALVHMGRPWAHPGEFDLLVTTPQYFLSAADNVLCNELPLHSLHRSDLHADREALIARLGSLAGPFTVVLVGGDSGRFVMTPEKAQALGRELDALQTKQGGSLLVTNSPRTPKEAWQALKRELQPACFVYDWQAGATDNPYRGLLALADRFVITGESMSMIAEAQAMHKPVHLFDLSDADGRWWLQRHNWRSKPLSHRLAMTLGPRRMRRDVGRIQASLVNSGRAVWLGQAEAEVANVGAAEDLTRTADRVRALIAAR